MTDAEAHDVRVSRVVPGTPEEVFDAYTDAGKQEVWYAILDEEPGVVRIETDLRVGGVQTAVWGPDEASLFREEQTFQTIDRPHRLVTESTGSTPDGMTLTTTIDLTFTAEGDGTRIDVVQTGFPEPEVRDFFANESWPGAFDRIGAYLRRA
ncbi:SRPBCC family protein [Actinomadura flavalba]|uniref:SRPBCC family protein n=1 Tax=Actinomadura flavalba TaxID=1120938 RepID=UPI000373B709|nr:SRPBCC domain-containing protein [Actinomadura flavalba]